METKRREDKARKGQGHTGGDGWRGKKDQKEVEEEREKETTNNHQVMQRYRCSLHSYLLRLFLFGPLLLPSALVSECYIRGGVTGAPIKSLTSLLLRPLFPPERAPATLIGWCRFTATGRPGEPLVSSLQFQNIRLNVLLFFSPPPPPPLKLPLSCSASCCLPVLLLLPFYVIPDTFSSNIWCDCLDNPKWGISVTPDPDGKKNPKTKSSSELSPDTFPLRTYLVLLSSYHVLKNKQTDNTAAAEFLFAKKQQR